MGAENAKIESAEKSAETGGHPLSDQDFWFSYRFAVLPDCA